MYSLKEDRSRYGVFESQSGVDIKAPERLNLKILEWHQCDHSGRTIYLQSVSELEQRPPCQLRIIFASLDIPAKETGKGHLALFNHLSIPSAFLSERLQSVAHSFGTKEDETGQSSWFHFLCKNITVEIIDEEPTIRNPNQLLFYLKCQPHNAWCKQITLVCFGASATIENRLEHLVQNPKWDEIVSDPYIIFDIISDDRFLQLDSMAWRLAQVFRRMEERVLEHAGEPESVADKFDLVGLQNVFKHAVYLRDASEAAIRTLQGMLQNHKRMEKHWSICESVQDSLQYCQSFFQSTQLRLNSLEKRVSSSINLAFNLVTQQDSRVMKKDSSSMKTIALMTLLFLPAGTVAGMFASQFFDLTVDDDGLPVFTTSLVFWIFWAITLPVTAFLVGLWSWQSERSMKRLKGGCTSGRMQDTVMAV